MISDQTLRVLAGDFIAYLGGDPKRGTVRAYADDLRQFVELLARRRVRKLGDVTREALYRYLADLRVAGYHPNTIHRRLAAVQSLYRYLAVERGWAHNPALRLRRERRPDPVPRAYDWATATEILASVPSITALDTRNRCLLATWMYAGLRIAETLGLDWHDVSMAARSIHVRRAKGGRERVVHFGDTLGEHLAAWRARSWCAAEADPVFVGKFGSRMDAKAVYTAIRKYGLFAKYGLTPHRLRHTHSTELLRRGVTRADGTRQPVSLHTLQARLGHRDLRSTMVYLRVFDEDETAAGEALG